MQRVYGKMRLKAVTGIVLTVLLLVVVSRVGVSVGVVDFEGESGDFLAQSSVDWWPMFHHDLSHSGYSTSTAPNTNNVLWSYQTFDYVVSSPAVVDGRVYVGSNDGKVYCLNASTGAKIWSYQTGHRVESSPAVADGRVYVGSYDHKVYCLDASTGAKIWSYETGLGGYVVSSPAVADGKVYVGSDDFTVYCLNASAASMTPAERKIWSYSAGSSVRSSPAVADGRVYVERYCLNASTGAQLFGYYGGKSSPAVVDGRLYVGSEDFERVYCYNASTGVRIWFYETGGIVESSPAVADGKVYVGSDDGNVYCLKAFPIYTNGEKIWSYKTGAAVKSSPAVADGRVYVGSCDGNFYCLDALTGAKIWSYGAYVESSPAVADGRVYVGSHDFERVYAFGLLCNLTITTTTGGTTNPSPGTHSYWDGTSVSVTAIPDANYVFDHWELDSAWNYSNPISVTMDSDHTLHAVFVPTYTLTITTTTGGTTSPSPGTHTYTQGTVVTVTASPYTNYEFDHWELDSAWNYSNPISVTMDSNQTLHAVFIPIYDVTIRAYCYNESAYVSVSITMDGSSTGYTTPHTFTGLNGTHTFTVPNTDPHGYPFTRWSTAETNTTITVTSGGTYLAYYGTPPPPPVGGVWVPVDKFGLLAPYIALASTILVATAATAIYVKRRKKKK